MFKPCSDHDTMLDTMEEVDIKSETIESKENYENVNENLQCEICDLKFPYFLLLKLHNFEHHKDSDIKVCPYCNYKVGNSSKLNDHIEIKHPLHGEKV